MPRCMPARPVCRTLKSYICEAIMLIAMMAIVGHLSVNFWERYIIQSELLQMKQSLQFLKTAMNNIGNAYDKLHTQIRRLSDVTVKKSSLQSKMIDDIPPDHDTYDDDYSSSSETQHEKADKNMYDENNNIFNGPLTESNNENYFLKENNADDDSTMMSPKYHEDRNREENTVAENKPEQYSGKRGAKRGNKQFPFKNTEKENHYYSRENDADNEASFSETQTNVDNDDKYLHPNADADNRSNRALKENSLKNKEKRYHKKTNNAAESSSTIARAENEPKHLPLNENDKYVANQLSRKSGTKDTKPQDLSKSYGKHDPYQVPKNDEENVDNAFSQKSLKKDETNQFSPKTNSRNKPHSKEYQDNDPNYLPINDNAGNVANQFSGKPVIKDEANQFPPEAISKNTKYLTSKSHSEWDPNNFLSNDNPNNLNKQNSKKSSMKNKATQSIPKVNADYEGKYSSQNAYVENNNYVQPTDIKNNVANYPQNNFRKGADEYLTSKGPAQNEYYLKDNIDNLDNQYKKKSVTLDEGNQFPPKANSRNEAKHLPPKVTLENEVEHLLPNDYGEYEGYDSVQHGSAKDSAYLPKDSGNNRDNNLPTKRNALNEAKQNTLISTTKEKAKQFWPKTETKNERNQNNADTSRNNRDNNLATKRNAINEAQQNPLITNTKDKTKQFWPNTETENEGNQYIADANSKNNQKYLPMTASTKNKGSQFPEKGTAANGKVLPLSKSSKSETNRNPSKGSGKHKVEVVKCSCNDTKYEILENKTTMTRYPAKSTGAGRGRVETQTIVTKDEIKSDAKSKLHKSYKQYTCYSGNPLNFWMY